MDWRTPPEFGAGIVVDDMYVSSQQLMLEESAEGRLRFRNLGRNDVTLSTGECFAQGQSGEAALPARLVLTSTVIHVERLAHALDAGHHVEDLDSVAGPLPPSSLPALGDAPSFEQLTSWFDTLLSVQRSAVGSDAFYDETSLALVDLIGLDRGVVLLRTAAGWRTVAGTTRDDKHALDYSTSIVERVAAEARTFFSNPRGQDIRKSIANLEAVVASPIFDENRNVVGILYGSRDMEAAQSAGTGHPIRPLEAQLVQVLANSVSAGLIRMSILERLKQAEQLAAVGQALGYILHDLRGPLGNAQQLAEMLRENDTTAMTREEQLDYIDESLAMSLELLNDTLEFCQGTVKLEPIPGDCQALLSKHLRMIELRLETARVPVQIDIPPGLSAVFDPARLGRVIYNLAKNAGEAVHGHPGGLVKITASRSSTGITFTVSDNGEDCRKRSKPSCFSRSAPLGNGAAPALDLPSQNNWSTHTGAVSTPRRARRAPHSRFTYPSLARTPLRRQVDRFAVNSTTGGGGGGRVVREGGESFASKEQRADKEGGWGGEGTGREPCDDQAHTRCCEESNGGDEHAITEPHISIMKLLEFQMCEVLR